MDKIIKKLILLAIVLFAAMLFIGFCTSRNCSSKAAAPYEQQPPKIEHPEKKPRYAPASKADKPTMSDADLLRRLQHAVDALQESFNGLHRQHQVTSAKLRDALLREQPDNVEIENLQQRLDELMAEMHDRAARLYEESTRLSALYVDLAMERLEDQ